MRIRDSKSKEREGKESLKYKLVVVRSFYK